MAGTVRTSPWPLFRERERQDQARYYSPQSGIVSG